MGRGKSRASHYKTRERGDKDSQKRRVTATSALHPIRNIKRGREQEKSLKKKKKGSSKADEPTRVAANQEKIARQLEGQRRTHRAKVARLQQGDREERKKKALSEVNRSLLS